MSQCVVVSYGTDREYEVTVPDADTAKLTKDQARAWLSKEFETLECTPSNPMGKILVLDMVLNVAKYGGEDHFKRMTEWSKQFAAAAVVALGRPVITVDVGNHVVR
jgi:hypothetical protein